MTDYQDIFDGIMNIFGKWIKNHTKSPDTTSGTWLQLTEDIKYELTKLNSEDKKRAKKKQSVKLRDPNTPKKNKSAYLYFCIAKRNIVKAELGDVKTTEVTRELGLRWKMLKKSDKVSDKSELACFEEQATADKIRYDEEMKNYESPSDEKLTAMIKGISSRGGKKVVKRIRKNNGKNENEDINNLINHLNNCTFLGKKLSNYLKEYCSIEFKRAEVRNGNNRNTHYDFILIDKEGNEYKVEHKGGSTYKKIKDVGSKPWDNSVQFVNAGCEKFDICRLYARLWYDEYIKSGYLSRTYNLKSNIPTFNTWYKSDCCTQGDPKTLFGKEFKTFYRNEYGNSPRDLRIKINMKFLDMVKNNTKILDNFNISAVDIADKFLKEKHIWLQINGNVNGDVNKINFKWYREFKVDKKYTITNIKTNSDIEFIFTSDNPDYLDFSCRLRWGGGCGFSNLRVGFS